MTIATRVFSGVLGLGLVLAGGLFAAPAAADTAKKGIEVAAADAGAGIGVPAAEGTAPKVTRTAMGEWEVECFDPKVNGLNCQMVQKLVSKDTEQLVLVVSLAYAPETKKNLLQMALPLNFMLKPGVEIAIGDAKTVVQVDRCSKQGCFVEGIAGDDLVEAMIKGKTADVKFMANAEKRLVIPFSLAGFTKAYATMKDKNES